MNDHTPEAVDLPPDSTQTLASVPAGILRGPCKLCGGPLKGRQKAFCCRAHCTRWHDQQHPRVNAPLPPDGPREGATILRALIAHMIEHLGEMFTAHELGAAVRAFPHSVSARLSQIKKLCDAGEIPYGFVKDGRRGDSTRAHRFGLVAR